jgi:hypothetical protein
VRGALARPAGRCYIKPPNGDEPSAPAGNLLTGVFVIARRVWP